MFTLLPLSVATAHAELVDRLRFERAAAFAEGSTFRLRRIKGRDYWYVQEPTRGATRLPEQYLGPDTPELSASVAQARAAKTLADDRRVMVRGLLSAGLPGPGSLAGDTVAAMARAGVFRLRGMLVGTLAYQTYGGLLGVRLGAASMKTEDVDVAQDYGVSLALDDALPVDFLSVLRSVSPHFMPLDDAFNPGFAASYGDGRFRVDVLTTQRGATSRKPATLPALRTHARPLRFLDFLLRDAVEAVLLHRHGVLVRVPEPARFAVHKLILASLRGAADASKIGKDLDQAAALIGALQALRRSDEVEEAWHEAAARGAGWRQRLLKGRKRLPADIVALLPS